MFYDTIKAKGCSKKSGIKLFIVFGVILFLFCLIYRPVYAAETPTGYNDNDYQKLRRFFEQSNGGEKNGYKINNHYDPDDPTTWTGILWSRDLTKRVIYVDINSYDLVGVLDLSDCTEISSIYCSYNQLSSIDLSGCTRLWTLYCYGNQLTSIDVSGCSTLDRISCDSNQLRSLDLSSCKALTAIHCSFNQLNSLNVSGCTALEELSCELNELSSLDVSDCSALKYLYCESNQLVTLNVSGCSVLEALYCDSNQLSSLDVKNCISLEGLSCSSNQLMTLDLNKNTKLSFLICDANQLNSLSVSNNNALRYLNCSFNKLTSLDLNNNAGLRVLYCFSNQINDLNINNCTSLRELWCYSNKLSSLDVSSCTGLKYLYCFSNNLKFSDLPLPSVYDHYRYSPQAQVSINNSGEIVAKMLIDLSSELNIEGVTSDYTWYSDGIEINPSSAVDGKFSFDESFVGETIYCEINNSNFPDLILKTDMLRVGGAVIVSQPEDCSVNIGDTATFSIETDVTGDVELTYQWQMSKDGNSWLNIEGAVENSYTTEEVVADDNNNRYRCLIYNNLDDLSVEPMYSNPAILSVEAHTITFIKPTVNNDINNPVNINNGSLVIASISGDISNIVSLTLIVDNGEEIDLTPSNNVYYLLPNDLGSGVHVITITLTNNAEQEITSSVSFTWENYRKGFGFGRFDFGN